MRRMHFLWLIFLSGMVSAQFTYTAYNTSNSGISSNNISDIKIDNTGLLWIATNNGISTFNGTAFTKYNTGNSGIASNAIKEIEIYGLGRKLMATRNTGIVFF